MSSAKVLTDSNMSEGCLKTAGLHPSWQSFRGSAEKNRQMSPNTGVQSLQRLIQEECSEVLKDEREKNIGVTQQSMLAKADDRPVGPFIARFISHHQVLIDRFL